MHSDKGFKAACDTKKLKGKQEKGWEYKQLSDYVLCIQELALPLPGWLDTLCSQAPSFVFLLATTGTKSIWLWPTTIIIKYYDNKRKPQKLRGYYKRTGMCVCIYLGIFYYSNNILLPCIFWGFYNHVKLMRLGKDFLWYHFWFIYFTLAHSSW